MSLTTFLSLCCIGGRQLQLVQLIWGSVLLVKTGDILKNPDLMMTLLVLGEAFACRDTCNRNCKN